MAVFQSIRKLFVPAVADSPEIVVPAPQCRYTIRTLTDRHLKEVMLLNLRCFRIGENYTRFTFKYLLTDPKILSYQAVTPDDEMVGFVFIVTNDDRTAHITTIGTAPEHRRRGVARLLMKHVEDALARRDFELIGLEVRISNRAARKLYLKAGYEVAKRLAGYYNNGEDAYLMSKKIG